jgi:DNA polymerase-3 subunit alpha
MDGRALFNMKQEFVHLHVHSHYSLLDGACGIDPLLESAKRQGMKALALTDHGNLFGAIEFYRKAIQKGIKPILGCEAYVAPGSRTQKEASGAKEAANHLTILVRDETGYRNLMKLTTEAYLTGFYYKPRIDKELLAQHREGLILLSGCLKSAVNTRITQGNLQAAQETADELRQIVGKENFYVELMHHGIDQQQKNRVALEQIARDLSIPMVATNDVHYLSRDDARAHDALLCIGTNRLLQDSDRMRYATHEFYLKPAKEMHQIFSDRPDALRNTLEVAERCHLELDFSTKHLPRFQVPDGRSDRAFLRELCERGLSKRYPKVAQEQTDRLEYELGVIEQMGFASYFLIVWDFIQFAKRKGIPVGPGRGSVGGSLAAYVLEITEIDPLRHGLIFERFLEPGRITLPDIDIDFCQEGREAVIEYVRQKYGNEHVAQIITFGTMAARGVIRDVGRVLDLPLPEIDAIAKKIPQMVGRKEPHLREAVREDADLTQLYEKDERIRELFDISFRLEGLCRHASKHAAGVVIGDRPLAECLPLYRSEGVMTTQYAMEDLEHLGLLKMDFLGLRTLTVLDTACGIIRKRHGVEINLNALPMDDAGTYALLSRGETQGIFQCESDGMRDLMQKLQPSIFEDLIALVALYRPGPLGSGMVEQFVKCKHGQSAIQYLHPRLEPILRDTYGVIVYQEQVMQIAHRLAGFTMTEADHLRKAMGKKRPEIIAEYRERFISGSVKNRIPAKAAQEIFELISFFGGYGFNKSHSTAYALIAYQTAYLKTRYPTEFMAALMTWEMSNTDKIVDYMEECRRLGIKVAPPCVNESFAEFTVVQPKQIRFGLGAVKNVGLKAIASIVEGRQRASGFKSLYDFCEQVDLRLVNRAVIENLIKCGAFDRFGARRSQLAAIVDPALEVGGALQGDRHRGQETFFDDFDRSVSKEPSRNVLPEVPEWPESQLLAYEKKALGFYVSSHPLARYGRLLERFSSVSVKTLAELKDAQEAVLGGIIAKVKPTVTKRGKNQGERMAQFVLEDLTGSAACVIFPRDYELHRKHLAPDRIVFVRGQVDLRREEPSLKVATVIPVERVYEELASAVVIRLRGPGVDENTLYRLREALRTHPGSCPVFIELDDESTRDSAQVRVGSSFFVTPSEAFCQQVESITGGGHLSFRPPAVQRERYVRTQTAGG